MLFLNFEGDSIDTRTPSRFSAPGRYGADLDLASDSVRAFLQLLKDHNTVIDLTLATFEGMYTVRPGTMDEGGMRIASRMPAEVRRGFLAGGIAQSDSQQTRYRASWAKMQHTTEAPKQYQCRHIFTDGRRCASPCLRQQEFCYYHHTTRRPVANSRQRRTRRSTFN